MSVKYGELISALDVNNQLFTDIFTRGQLLKAEDVIAITGSINGIAAGQKVQAFSLENFVLTPTGSFIPIDTTTVLSFDEAIAGNYFTLAVEENGDWEIQFKKSGTIQFGTSLGKGKGNIDICIVGGGAGGGVSSWDRGGGGGGGKVVNKFNQQITATDKYIVTIGACGAANKSGGTSSFKNETGTFSFSAAGGTVTTNWNGGTGGSGGGGVSDTQAWTYAVGGLGGARGANGGNGKGSGDNTPGKGGAGQGDGTAVKFDSTIALGSGGGGFSSWSNSGGAAGGTGGGGKGGWATFSNDTFTHHNAGNGTAYTGGGGGGAWTKTTWGYTSTANAGTGGSGTIFIRNARS